MHEMSAIWLRVAAGLYAVGLLHTLLATLHSRWRIFRLSLGAFAVGVLLQLVSIVEQAAFTGHFPANDFYESASFCAFLLAALYLFVYWRYRLETLSAFVFPLVFVLTLVAAVGAPVPAWADSRVRDAWLLAHVTLVLTGYALLLITAVSSVAYLLRERQLKRKQPRAWAERPAPLGTLDKLMSRAMAVGFVFITLAVIAGTVWASMESGTRWIRDPRIVISLVTWGVYLLLVFLRTAAGWRGRKAAIMVIAVVGFSALTWAAHTSLRTLFSR